jgi:hypothetical protein
LPDLMAASANEDDPLSVVEPEVVPQMVRVDSRSTAQTAKSLLSVPHVLPDSLPLRGVVWINFHDII